MKKRKLKIKIKLVFLLFLLLFGITIIIVFKFNNKRNSHDNLILKSEEEIIKIVDIKIDGVEKDFLTWVGNKYPQEFHKMANYLEENVYNNDLWHEYIGYSYNALLDLYNGKKINIIQSDNISTISFVGDVSLADNWHIMPEYDKRNKKIYGILSEEIVDILTNSNFFVVNSEFTVSKRGNPLKGKMFTFEAKPERLNIYDEMGVDLALLANNHVYDFGKEAFLDMLGYFQEYNIPTIGAGHNLNEASQAYYIVLNGYKIAFLNCTRAEKNIMTPGATENGEGVFRCYDTTNMVNAIKNAKLESDYVIANVHFGKEASHKLEDVQISSAKEYIDAGADIVVGHHAHVLQGIEFYNDKPIIYNLGNFIFNNKTTDTAIFEVRLNSNGFLDYYIIPAIQEDSYTSLANNDAKKRIIKDLNSWSINTFIESDGHITKIED